MYIDVQADQSTVVMGRSVCFSVRLQANEPQKWVLLPVVNGRRWGHHEIPADNGEAIFTIPFPNVGPAHIRFAAVPRDASTWMGVEDINLLLAGTLVHNAPVWSTEFILDVIWRSFPPLPQSDTLFCMQWEPWFANGINSWHTTQAVPLIGLYDSHDPAGIRQHLLWMMDLGVDFIMPDWTNHLWGKSHWDERSDWVNALIHTTTLFLETLAVMKGEGLPVPKVALFPGLSNGRPTTMEALNEELAWIYHTYLRNPRFAGLWQEWEGKPLMVVLDTGGVGDKRARAETSYRIPFFKHTLEMSAEELDAWRAKQPEVDQSQFTVRWMSSQNQATRHHELGYWSWMDGVPDPPVTMKDGVAEAITVTPAFFNALGWTDKEAWGRKGGITYLETFSQALQARPKVVFLHQFNEFTGQREGYGMGVNRDIYADTYNVEFSDDLEPVSPNAPGYRHEKPGWGFFYLNLTQALMGLYRGLDQGSTILVADGPHADALAVGRLRITWKWLGAQPQALRLLIDAQPIGGSLSGEEADIPLPSLAPGPHVLTLFAEGAHTRYPLSLTRLDEPSADPLPVQVELPFVIPQSI